MTDVKEFVDLLDLLMDTAPDYPKAMAQAIIERDVERERKLLEFAYRAIEIIEDEYGSSHAMTLSFKQKLLDLGYIVQ